MANTTDSPVIVADTWLAAREGALLAAERFLADTSEAVNPDTPAPALLRYTVRYRAHLATVVAANRRLDGKRPGDAPTHEGPGPRPFPHLATDADRLQST